MDGLFPPCEPNKQHTDNDKDTKGFHVISPERVRPREPCRNNRTATLYQYDRKDSISN